MSRFTAPIAALLALTFAAIAVAGTGALDRIVTVDIGAQPLSTALIAFSKQAGVQVITPAAKVSRLETQGVRGEMPLSAALEQLLKGTNLGFHAAGDNTIGLDAAAPAAAAAGVAVHLAQAEEPSPAQGEGQGEDFKKEETSEGYRKGIPEILVRGSRSKSLNADIERSQDDIQPYVVIDRKLIERSAATNVGDLLRSFVTMNYVPSSNQQTGADNTSTVALRGLGSSQTLILIDGRRTTARGFSGNQLQPDLNGIPVSAIERIEVLPATASGIYGGNATGGVVNVVLRRDYSGIEAKLNYENSFTGGGRQRGADISGGFSFNDGKTSLMLIGGFTETDPLLAEQRRFFSDYVVQADANRRALDPTYFTTAQPPLGATPNISAAPSLGVVPAGTPGALCAQGTCFANVVPNLSLKPQYGGSSLGSPITYLPDGYPGLASGGVQAITQNAGAYNLALADTLQPGAGGSSLLADTSTRALDVTLRHQFSSQIETFLSLSGSRNEASFVTIPGVYVFKVNASAPNNPFSQNVNVAVPFSVQAPEASSTTDSSRMLLGTKMRLGAAWSAGVEYSFSQSKFRGGNASGTFLPSATADIAAGRIDVLKAPPEGGFDLSQYTVPAASYPPSKTYEHSASARFAGPIFSLPAGQVALTTLLEHRRQEFGDFYQNYFSSTGVPQEIKFSDQASRVSSAYAEMQIPVISDVMRVPVLREVSVQIAGRFDSYRNVGGVITQNGAVEQSKPQGSFHSFDPTFGLRVQPIESIAFRASYGRGYFPPPLRNLNPSPPTRLTVTRFVDPKRGNEPITNIDWFLGGNPNLLPEESKSTSAGVILTPLERLRFSFDWTKISKKNNISNAALNQVYIGLEDQIPNLVIRNTDPSTFGVFGVGPVVGYNGASRNATNALSESYDISVNYLVATGSFGEFEFYGNGTRLLHSSLQLAPLQDSVENAAVYTTPRWQANASLTWTWRAFSTTWLAKYLDSGWLQSDHMVVAGQDSDRVSSQTYHDLAFQYRFGGLLTSGAASTSLQLGVKNVFNTRPRFLGARLGVPYDYWASPMMATYYASVIVGF